MAIQIGELSQSKLMEMIDTEPLWHHIVRWSREQLKSENYLDLSTPRGVWRLNEEGQKAAGTYRWRAISLKR